MFQDEMLPELSDDLLERSYQLAIIEEFERKIAPSVCTPSLDDNQETVLPL